MTSIESTSVLEKGDYLIEYTTTNEVVVSIILTNKKTNEVLLHLEKKEIQLFDSEVIMAAIDFVIATHEKGVRK